MEFDMVARREQAMDRAGRALDAAWPKRKGADYVREMQSAAKELEKIAREMQAKGVGPVEKSRTYRYLGSVYADLAPALGREMLIKAKKSYEQSEMFLEGYHDDLERAKLNFNLGNTLRQMDPNDIGQLQEAEKRFVAARKVFTKQAPQFIEQVDSALISVRTLLKIAPIALAIEHNYAEMEALKKELASGANVSEIIHKVRNVMTKDGGLAGLIGRIKTLTSSLPKELRESDTFSEIHQKLNSLAELAIGGSSAGSQEKHILEVLRKRLKAELEQGKVTGDRADTLIGVVERLGSILAAEGDNPIELLDSGQRLRELINTQFESQHYLSHGLDRPPTGSRAAELVELCWLLRRYLLEEMNRSGKGPDESKEALRLNIQAAKVDKRIYEAGDDSDRALTVDKEELRPLALAVRSFSDRWHPMIAQPIWTTAKVPVDISAVFYSGSADLRRRVKTICNRIGLCLMSAPTGESIANARWKQLQKAMLAIFDLGIKQGAACAAVAYELGIALALGKPLVIISSKERPLPFDVDVEPVILSGDSNDNNKMSSAIDQSIVWTYSRGFQKAFLATLDHILKKYPRPQKDTYLDQTLKLLFDQRRKPDPLAVNRTLKQFADFLEDDTTTLIHPVWRPKYPELDHPRLFHVMPYRPKWAAEATRVTRRICDTKGADYVRGDEVEDPNVIRSIWQEIAGASHALVDLTGFNANVALELGIVHTLGCKSLLVGQGDTVERLFPMIAKLRVYTYQHPEELGKLVRAFLK